MLYNMLGASKISKLRRIQFTEFADRILDSTAGVEKVENMPRCSKKKNIFRNRLFRDFLSDGPYRRSFDYYTSKVGAYNCL